MKKVFILLSLSLLFVACDKDQKRVNKLEGKWSATSFIFNSPGESSTYNIIEEDDRQITWDFLECDLDKGDECICNWQTIDYTGYVTDVQYFYKVTNDGETLTLYGTEYDEIYTITKFKGGEMEMDQLNDNGSSVFIILEKED